MRFQRNRWRKYIKLRIWWHWLSGFKVRRHILKDRCLLHSFVTFLLLRHIDLLVRLNRIVLWIWRNTWLQRGLVLIKRRACEELLRRISSLLEKALLLLLLLLLFLELNEFDDISLLLLDISIRWTRAEGVYQIRIRCRRLGVIAV